MSLTKPPEGLSACGVSQRAGGTFPVWQGDRTGRKGSRLPFSWASWESH